MSRTGLEQDQHGGPVAPASAQDLPVLALSRPQQVAQLAAQVLAGHPGRADRCSARQALGIASRELGDVAGALRHLRAALRDARTLSPAVAADVEASLGATLAFAGRPGLGLRHLDAALGAVGGAPAARIGVRRGFLLQVLGRTAEAVEQLRAAARVLRAAGDHVWEARALINLAQALIDGGEAGRANDALRRAETLLSDAGHCFEAAVARHNRGLVAALLGQLPAALAHYEAAEKMYAEAGARPPELSEARAAALLAAGLPGDALEAGGEAVAQLRNAGASSTYLANALLRVSDAALAADDPGQARVCATQAVVLFRRQGRARGVGLARLGVVRARYASGERSRRLLRDVRAAAGALDAHRVPQAVEAHLLAGQVALDVGDAAAAAEHLDRAAAGRSRGSALDRVLGWRAAALRAQAAGRSRGVLDACERGLQTLDAHQLTLGALEMRAAATAHGRELAVLAVREALSRDDPVLLLRWTERWRATAAALPPVHPPDDAELAAGLGALRHVRRQLEAAMQQGEDTGRLERECRRLEAEVVGRTRAASPTGGEQAGAGRDVSALLAALDGVLLVELVRVDDTVHVLLASTQGVRHRVAGSWSAAVREAKFARFALQRLAYDLRPATARAALDALDGRALQEQLLGPVADELGEGTVVLAPPASLHAVPWGLLPALADRPFSVAASGSVWANCRATPPPEERSVLLVAGPGLTSCGSEVAALAEHYPDGELLRDGTATAERVLAGLDGRWLAHVAAHGTFRADNPLFSALELDDGPLTLLDLQRLRRAPYRLIASSCHSGLSATTGADELLGLASALAPLGTAGVLASVVAVNDGAAVPFAQGVHAQLRAGRSTAEALHLARQRGGEPVETATARSFVAFGAV